MKLGIIGTGGIANTLHGPMIQAAGLDVIHLVAGADTNAASLAIFSQKYGLERTFTDYRDLLADGGVDAVAVLTPHDSHRQICVDALAAGKHVLVEKPIARNLSEAAAILNASHRSGMVLMLGHNQRYMPGNQLIRQIIDSGEIGEVFSIRADHFLNYTPVETFDHWWRRKDVVGGGCTIGSGVHRLDLLRWYGGNVAEVYALQHFDAQRHEAEVFSTALLRFENGASGEFYCNWSVYQHHYCEALMVCGTRGSVYWEGERPAVQLCRHSVNNGRMEQVPLAEHSFQNMYAHFAACVREGKRPLSGGEEGYRALELVEALSRSAQTGKPVGLPLEKEEPWKK